MSHSITCTLNNDAREHPNASGITFFIGLGEKNYNFKTKENEFTNYDAAIFAKAGQDDFYRKALVAGSVVSVSGSGIILDASNPEYKPKLVLQDAKLKFVKRSESNIPAQQAAPKQRAPQQSAPVQEPYRGAPVQQQQSAPQAAPSNSFDDFSDDIPF